MRRGAATTRFEAKSPRVKTRTRRVATGRAKASVVGIRRSCRRVVPCRAISARTCDVRPSVVLRMRRERRTRAGGDSVRDAVEERPTVEKPIEDARVETARREEQTPKEVREGTRDIEEDNEDGGYSSWRWPGRPRLARPTPGRRSRRAACTTRSSARETEILLQSQAIDSLDFNWYIFLDANHATPRRFSPRANATVSLDLRRPRGLHAVADARR